MIAMTAAAAIDQDDETSDWQLRPDDHARKLPSEAGALKRVLERADLTQIIEGFRHADKAAVIAQMRYKRIGRLGLYAATLATLIGALFLMPLERWITGAPAGIASAAQMLGLAVAFFASRLLAVTKLFDKWMKSRAEAEIARVALFDAVIKTEEEAHSGEIALLPLKLEYFRRYQLDVQRRYYRGRGAAHAASVWRNNRLLGASVFITVASVSLGALAGLHLVAAWQLPLPAPLQSMSLSLAGPGTNRLLLGLGVIASGLYGLGVARSLMDLDERNASRYLTTADNLTYLMETQLPQAREAAASGALEDVLTFVRSVQSLISSEHQEWIVLGSRERNLERLRRAAKMR
jgi:hypothetical protein